VGHTPQQLRREAEHCRELAGTQFDARVRTILKDMADDLQRQAFELETAQHNPGPHTPPRG
jgi:hypothetical protein